MKSAAIGGVLYLVNCLGFTLSLSDGWSLLAIVTLTVTIGGVAVIGFLAVCALMAQRQRYEFHAWRHQIEVSSHPVRSIDR